MPTKAPRMDSSTTGRHIHALDGIRGLAVLLVLMDHLFWSNPIPEGGRLVRFLAQVRGAGWVGVDLFFVLSGFLITGILYNTVSNKHFFRNFYVRRVLRIFPLYYGFLFIVMLAVWLRGEHWTHEIYRLLTDTQNLHLLTYGPFFTAAWVNVNHFWSLAVEEQFYFVWPVLVFALRTRRSIAIAATVGALASLVVRIALLHSSIAEHNHYVLFSWTPSHVDGLLAGAVVAMLIRSRHRAKAVAMAPAALLLSGAGLATMWWVNSGLEWEHPLWVAVYGTTLLSILFAALVAVSLENGGVFNRIFSLQWLRFFGRYSYGLYVYHYTLMAMLAPHIHEATLARTHSKMLAVLVTGLVVFVITIVVAWVSYNFYEKRFLLLKDRFSSERSGPKLSDVAATL